MLLLLTPIEMSSSVPLERVKGSVKHLFEYFNRNFVRMFMLIYCTRKPQLIHLKDEEVNTDMQTINNSLRIM